MNTRKSISPRRARRRHIQRAGLIAAALICASRLATGGGGSILQGVVWTGREAVRVRVSDIMERERATALSRYEGVEFKPLRVRPDRSGLPQNPAVRDEAPGPAPASGVTGAGRIPFSPRASGVSFTGGTLFGVNPTFAFPPDDMGAVGPTQYIVMINNRIVTFSKATGTADGVLNATTNVFFSAVRSSSGTSDPRIRYDRLSGRWFLVMINVSTPNRIMIATSAAGTISAGSDFSFTYIPIDSLPPSISPTCLCDYPTLGIDANALYIGGNNFCGSPVQTFTSTDGYVVRKSSLLSGGPIVATVFRGLVPSSSAAGPYTPQGVDNFDAGAAEGYFIGVDNATFSTLMIRRVTNPATVPAISGNIPLSVPSTQFPLPVRHQGNTGGTSGLLDAIDDRLYAATVRNGRLWTAHNIGVNNAGTTTGTRTRDAARWYEIGQPGATPVVLQSGTLFTATAGNDVNQRNYWMPSIMPTGQGHAAMGFSTAGTNEYANAAVASRLAGDFAGTLATPVMLTASTTAYNPPGDPGDQFGRRWGDYSYTSLDPDDDMTLWTIQQFCDAANSYGCRVVQLPAPPPATPATAGSVPPGESSVDVPVTGVSASGSGFFDPGPGFSRRISASAGGGITVNGVTFTDSTHVTLDVSTAGVAGGFYDVTITNPDGQSATGSAILHVDPALSVQLAAFTGSAAGERAVRLEWSTLTETNNYGFIVEQKGEGETNFAPASDLIAGAGTTLEEQSYVWIDDGLSPGRYTYRLRQIDLNGDVDYSHEIVVALGVPLSAGAGQELPRRFELEQNHPNPFNPSTRIRFALPVRSAVRLEVFDPLGRRAASLAEGAAEAGFHAVDWAPGGASGVYLYRLSATALDGSGRSFSMLRKMILLR